MEVLDVTDKKGRTIQLRSSDHHVEIEAYFNNHRIGSFFFDYQDDECDEWLLVVNMHLEGLPGFKRSGIGEAIVDWAEKNTGLKVVFGRSDGMKSTNGSHLTGDGPAFADYMRNR